MGGGGNSASLNDSEADVDFSTGRICYLLNNENTDGTQTWYQKLGSQADALPVFTKSADRTVYRHYTSCNGTSVYSNNSKDVNTRPEHVEYDNDGTILCSRCGEELRYEPRTLVTEGNYASLGLTEDYIGYYAISTAAELDLFRRYVNEGHLWEKCVLLADIDLAGRTWTPLGLGLFSFKGTFDGHYHTIKNLYAVAEKDFEAGFFGRAQGATIRNLIIENAKVTSMGNVQAGILGGKINKCTVQNCATYGNLAITTDHVQRGGLAGEGSGSTFINCFTSHNILANNPGTVTNCYTPAGANSANGELCYLLNGDQSNIVWYQKLGAAGDAYPVFCATADNMVYKNYLSCRGDFGYSNQGVHLTIPEHDGKEQGDALLCSVCGINLGYIPAPLVDGVYMIGDYSQLFWFAEQVNKNNANFKNAKAKLTANIVVNAGTFDEDGNWSEKGTPLTWTPMGTFSGSFNGNGHTISGLYVNNSGKENVALFSKTDGASIDSLGIINSYLCCKYYLGAISGDASSTKFRYCYAENSTIKGNDAIGGLASYAKYCSFEHCYTANTKIISGGYGGGLLENGTNDAFSNCYSAATITAKHVYGFAGTINSTYNNSYSVDIKDWRVNLVPLEDVTSGRLCYLLNGHYTDYGKFIAGTPSNNNGWYQKLDGKGNTHPALKGNAADLLLYEGYDKCIKTYSSTDNLSKDGSGHIYPEEYSEEGIDLCSRCGNTLYQPAVLVDNYYQISKAGQLYWFAEKVNNGDSRINGRLMADIVVNKNVLDENYDLNPGQYRNWTPIGHRDGGDSQRWYYGHFDGNWHTISGIYCNIEDRDHIGLFAGLAKEAKVTNLGLVDTYIRSLYNLVGTIASQLRGELTNCYTIANVYHRDGYGGLVYYLQNGRITSCYSTGKDNGCEGLACTSYGTNTVKNSYSTFKCNVAGEQISSAEVASGALTYLLNDGKTEGDLPYYQKLGTDLHPVFKTQSASIVYSSGTGGGYEHGSIIANNLSNDPTKVSNTNTALHKRAYNAAGNNEDNHDKSYVAGEWKWKDNGPDAAPTAEVTFTCSVCGKVVKPELTITLDESTSVAPKCTEKGVNCYKASKSFNDKAVFESEPFKQELAALGHDYSNKILSATADASGLYSYVCGNDDSHKKEGVKLIKNYKPGVNTELTENGPQYAAASRFDLDDDCNVDVKATVIAADKPTYTRTMKEQWGTLVVPFDVALNEFTQSFTCYDMAGITADRLMLKKMSGTLAANHPVLVRIHDDAIGAEGNLTLEAKNNVLKLGDKADPVRIYSDSKMYELMGTYSQTVPVSTDFFVSNNAFMNCGYITEKYPSAKIRVNPFRAYIHSDNTSEVKQLNFVTDDIDTSISPTLLKEMEGAVFNLKGQKLTAPQKGVNIINGKKIIVK